jgi:hypothetical protein
MYPLRDGLPPVPPLIPSPTSPGATKFVHYKQTISPNKTHAQNDARQDVEDGEKILESTERATEVVSRKREHSPEKNHFNFESSIVTASKKQAFVHNTSVYDTSDTMAVSPGKSVLNYVGPRRPVVHNGVNSSKEAPRLSRRDPVVPSRLSDYEVPHIKSAHHKITRVIKSQDTPTPVIKFGKTIKNGHHVAKNGLLENRVVIKKEPLSSAVNRTIPNNNYRTPALSPKSSDEDGTLSPLSPTSPYQQRYSAPATERTRKTSSSSTDSGTEEPREGECSLS